MLSLLTWTQKSSYASTQLNTLSVNSPSSTVNRDGQPLRNTLSSLFFFYPISSNSSSRNRRFASLIEPSCKKFLKELLAFSLLRVAPLSKKSVTVAPNVSSVPPAPVEPGPWDSLSFLGDYWLTFFRRNPFLFLGLRIFLSIVIRLHINREDNLTWKVAFILFFFCFFLIPFKVRDASGHSLTDWRYTLFVAVSYALYFLSIWGVVEFNETLKEANAESHGRFLHFLSTVRLDLRCLVFAVLFRLYKLGVSNWF